MWYVLSDEEQDTLELEGLFSIDSGLSWSEATLKDHPQDLIVDVYSGEIAWSILEDVGFQRLNNVQFALVPFDKDEGMADTTGYFSILNYPADFNGDLMITPDDLVLLAYAWNFQDRLPRFSDGFMIFTLSISCPFWGGPLSVPGEPTPISPNPFACSPCRMNCPLSSAGSVFPGYPITDSPTVSRRSIWRRKRNRGLKIKHSPALSRMSEVNLVHVFINMVT